MGGLPAGFRRLVMAAALFALVASLVVVPHPAGPASAEEPVTAPPNVVVILADDMGTDLMDAPRKTNDLLLDEGQSFSNAIATTALCCPARAALLTGTYAHTNGVWQNNGPNGGWSTFQPLESQTPSQ